MSLTFATFKQYATNPLHKSKADVTVVVERITHITTFMVGGIQGTRIHLDTGIEVQVEGLPSEAKRLILHAVDAAMPKALREASVEASPIRREDWERTRAGNDLTILSRASDPLQERELPIDPPIVINPSVR